LWPVAFRFYYGCMAFDPVVQGDKRRTQRVGAPKVVVRIPSADRFRSHYLKDLSEGGLFIRADRTFPVGADLNVELWPPGGSAAVSLQARIARVTEPAAARPGHPAGMAVSFVNLAPEAQERLRELIAEHGRPVFTPEAAEADPLGQVQQMVAELDETREQLSALSAELAEARGQIEAYADQAAKLEAQEAEARATALKRAEACAALELENQKLRADLDAAQARERELGKLLSGVGKKPATGKHAPAPKAPAHSPRSEPPVEIVMPAVAKPPPPPPPPPPQVTDSVDLAFDALIDGSGAAPDGAGETLVDEPLFDEADQDIELDIEPETKSQPPAHDELASFLGGSTEVAPAAEARPPEPPVVGGMAGFVLESSIADGRVGYEAFSKKIKLTTRLMPTDALQSRKPSSVDEALLSELLGAAPTFETLLNQMGGQMKDLRLRQMLYELYARALVDLREG